jgi:AcrR family transcriptional regulator
LWYCVNIIFSFSTAKVEELSKSLWSGDRPKNGSEAKIRVCRAALECLKRLGLEKTSMSDIAKEAGISRPTLYKYFKNKNEVFFTAIDMEAHSFAESVIEHARQFATIEERIVETIVYVVEELPKDQNLSFVLNHELAGALRDRAFSDEATLVFSEMTALPLIEIRPDLADQGVEISEIMARFAISLILFPGKYSTDYDGLRQLIRKRILPGLV